MKKQILPIALLFLFSCSLLDKRRDKDKALVLNNYEIMGVSDYIDHLSNLKSFYLDSDDVEQFLLTTKDKAYLDSLAQEIYKKNELFFIDKKKPTFIVIKDDRPFHFSLPNGKLFMSSGFIARYIKSERLLYCVIAYELVRIEKNIYRKAQIIPTGVLSTPDIISILRLDVKTKIELHKWSSYILRRVGVDIDNYLSWLQLQNRNSIDFSLQLGDLESISREEALFKSFIVSSNAKRNLSQKYERSSRDFYYFINRVKG